MSQVLEFMGWLTGIEPATTGITILKPAQHRRWFERSFPNMCRNSLRLFAGKSDIGGSVLGSGIGNKSTKLRVIALPTKRGAIEKE